MNQGSAKKVKTVRFDDMELERIRSAAIRHHLSEVEVIRKVVSIGLPAHRRGAAAASLPGAGAADDSRPDPRHGGKPGGDPLGGQCAPYFTLDVKRKKVYSPMHDSIICL